LFCILPLDLQYCMQNMVYCGIGGLLSRDGLVSSGVFSVLKRAIGERTNLVYVKFAENHTIDVHELEWDVWVSAAGL
jgi:hypothetical protein